MKVNNLKLSFGTNQIFDGASFMIENSDKAAIVGVNGAGKSTLFKVLLGLEKPEEGSVETNKMKIGYLPQEVVVENDTITAYDYISMGRPILELENRLTNLYNSLMDAKDDEINKIYNKIDMVQHELDYYDYYNADNQLDSIVSKMNIKKELLNQPLKTLSGGQKSKVAFAKLLYSKFDCLLLDEPTNHLDNESKEYILNYLKNYKGLVLVISHDIEFINKFINKTIYLNKANHKIYVFDGNYDDYIKKYQEMEYAKDKLIERQDKEIEELSNFVKIANQASRTNHHLKAMGQERALKLEKLEASRIKKEQKYGKIHIDIKPRFAPARMPLEVNDITFSYKEGKNLYEHLSFNLLGTEKFLIVGPNGIGKSTLLKIIMGKLKPQTGKVIIDDKTDYAYYAQEMETLDMKKSILENCILPEYTETEVRSLLGNFLFYKDDVYKKISTLSPGERARVALTKLLLAKPNMLILDEPTNHLDPDTQKLIGENFNEFKGTILMVSHNPSFAEAVGITRMLVLPVGKIIPYSHDTLMYYHELNTKE